MGKIFTVSLLNVNTVVNENMPSSKPYPELESPIRVPSVRESSLH